MSLVAHDKPAIVEQPANGALDCPASFVSSKGTAVLRRRLGSSPAMRADQFDAALGQTRAQGIAVSSPVVDQSLWASAQDALLQERFDQPNLSGTGTGDVDAQRCTATVDEEHDLRPFPALGLADASPPFLAGENVPSAIVSSQRSAFNPSSLCRSRAHACWKIPDTGHSWSRRQQVAGEGKCVGKSFQRAPLINTQRIPSRQARGGIG